MRLKNKMKKIFTVCLALLFYSCVWAQQGQLKGQQLSLDVPIQGKTYKLEAMLYKPQNIEGATFPLIISTHGRYGPSPSRRPHEIFGLSAMARELAAKGFMVMHLVRRGYGNSEGPDSEFMSTAEASGLAGAQDIAAAVEFMRQRPDVQPNRIAIIGQSQGGWMALASSTLPMNGVMGIVNFSGATNFAEARNYNINSYAVENQLGKAASAYGKSSQIPVLWLYASNDNHSVATVKDWFGSFQASGGKGRLVFTEAFQPRGHAVASTPSYYIDTLMSFFTEVGLLEK